MLAVDHVSRSLDGLRDIPVKIAYLRDRFARQSAQDVVAFLALVLGSPWRVKRRDQLAPLALWILAGPSASPIRREALASAARRRSLDNVAFFVEPRAPEVPKISIRAMSYGGERPLTLGERKSLARGRDRLLLQRVLRDPSQDVIAILLGSPHVRTEDVIRLSARRPAPSDVLETILADVRWAFRYEIRLALLQNPHLPLGLAVPLSACLRVPDARRLQHAGSLRSEIRLGASRVAAAAKHETH